jgi:ferredoxin-type protein NapH
MSFRYFNRWTTARRSIQLLVIALLASPLAGFSFFQGTLSAADLSIVPLADPLAALQILLAAGIAVPAFIGSAAAVSLFYFLLGGRTFCSWVCPVYLLTEFSDKLRERFQTGRATFPLALKQGLLVLILLATALTGLPVFETISPIGIASRAIAFNLWSGCFLLFGVVLAEVLFSRRLWCRSLCPLGAYYVIVGRYTPLKVRFDDGLCTQCGECSRICPVEEVLAASLTDGVKTVCSGECTRCGLCLDACKARALKASYSFLQ